MDTDSTEEEAASSSFFVPIRAPLTIDSDSEFSVPIQSQVRCRTSSFSSSDNSSYGSEYDDQTSVQEEQDGDYATYPDEETVLETSDVEESAFSRLFVRYPHGNFVKNSNLAEESGLYSEELVAHIKDFVKVKTTHVEETVMETTHVEESAFSRLYVGYPDGNFIKKRNLGDESAFCSKELVAHPMDFVKIKAAVSDSAIDPGEETVVEISHVEESAFSRVFVGYPDGNFVKKSNLAEESALYSEEFMAHPMDFVKVKAAVSARDLDDETVIETTQESVLYSEELMAHSMDFVKVKASFTDSATDLDEETVIETSHVEESALSRYFVGYLDGNFVKKSKFNEESALNSGELVAHAIDFVKVKAAVTDSARDPDEETMLETTHAEESAVSRLFVGYRDENFVKKSNLVEESAIDSEKLVASPIDLFKVKPAVNLVGESAYFSPFVKTPNEANYSSDLEELAAPAMDFVKVKPAVTNFATDPDQETVIQTTHAGESAFTRPLMRCPDEIFVKKNNLTEKFAYNSEEIIAPPMDFVKVKPPLTDFRSSLVKPRTLVKKSNLAEESACFNAFLKIPNEANSRKLEEPAAPPMDFVKTTIDSGHLIMTVVPLTGKDSTDSGGTKVEDGRDYVEMVATSPKAQIFDRDQAGHHQKLQYSGVYFLDEIHWFLGSKSSEGASRNEPVNDLSSAESFKDVGPTVEWSNESLTHSTPDEKDHKFEHSISSYVEKDFDRLTLREDPKSIAISVSNEAVVEEVESFSENQDSADYTAIEYSNDSEGSPNICGFDEENGGGSKERFVPESWLSCRNPRNGSDCDESEEIKYTTVKFPRLVRLLGLSADDPTVGDAEPDQGDQGLEFRLTVLVVGKTGVGKSATINSIFGENRASTSAFRPATAAVTEYDGVVDGVRLRILDTPGLRPSPSERLFNRKTLSSIKKLAAQRPPDVVLYVDRLDTRGDGPADARLLRSVAGSLGPSVWRRCVVALTHSASVSCDAAVTQRCRFVQRLVLRSCGDGGAASPVCLVENQNHRRKSRQPLLLLTCYSVKMSHSSEGRGAPIELEGETRRAARRTRGGFGEHECRVKLLATRKTVAGVSFSFSGGFFVTAFELGTR